MIPAQWLQLVPGCQPGQEPRSIVRLAGGTAHQLWRIQTIAGDYVLRAPDDAVPVMAKTEFVTELRLQRVAASANLAPGVVNCDEARGVLVMPFIEGVHPTERELVHAPVLGTLLAALQRLHELPAPLITEFDPLENLQALAQQLAAAQVPDALLIQRRLRRALALWRSGAGDSRQPAVIHCDPHVGNIIVRSVPVDDSPLALLDWEYASVGDPVLDYAALCSQYPEAAADTVRHLATLPAGARISAHRLASASAVFAVLSWLWWRARALQRPNLTSQARHVTALDARLDELLDRAEANNAD